MRQLPPRAPGWPGTCPPGQRRCQRPRGAVGGPAAAPAVLRPAPQNSSAMQPEQHGLGRTRRSRKNGASVRPVHLGGGVLADQAADRARPASRGRRGSVRAHGGRRHGEPRQPQHASAVRSVISVSPGWRVAADVRARRPVAGPADHDRPQVRRAVPSAGAATARIAPAGRLGVIRAGSTVAARTAAARAARRRAGQRAEVHHGQRAAGSGTPGRGRRRRQVGRRPGRPGWPAPARPRARSAVAHRPGPGRAGQQPPVRVVVELRRL